MEIEPIYCLQCIECIVTRDGESCTHCIEKYVADDPKHYLEWTVKLKVHKIWVRDGFSLKTYEGDDELTGDDFVQKLKFLTDFTEEYEFLVEVIQSPTEREMKQTAVWDGDGEY